MPLSRSLRYLCVKTLAIACLLCGSKRRALGWFDVMLQLLPSSRYAMASRAYLQGALGQTDAAIASLVALTSACPADASAWFNLGFLLDGRPGDGQAELAFRRAISLEPGMDRAWYGLALLLIRQRRYDEAVEALKANTRLQPMSPFGWYQLARVHAERQDIDEATTIIRHLKTFEPKVAAQLTRETGLPQNAFLSTTGV